MLVSREDVLKFIPQREPIVVVHGLTEHEENSSTSVFRVEENHLFVRDGKFLPSGLMENVAQTSALRSGYQFSLQAPKDGVAPEPPIGFIGALKNFQVKDLPSVGSTLYTTVKVAYEVMGMQVVEASVKCGKNIIASCEMKIFLSQETPQD
jgi:3-hydroxymyristoyl/3-hydroxydecanoyl-(acyl carrier protein) dehydratase